ncbi:MAG TPA: polysaccharide deacetylase family protein [Acidimicrobiales bacterium]|nr:polysaccharide deacetylase family protein [Acidimicrobiales bacterium]
MRPSRPADLPAAARRVPGALRGRLATALVARAGARRSLDPAAGAVALTFDDGPDPVFTPALLDELARLQVTATFFLVGRRAEAHPALVRRILADGHTVGSHSSTHPDPWRLGLRQLAGDYRRGRSQVERAAGRPAPLFRPPKGYVNGTGAAAMLAARARPWLWTIDPHDWEPGATTESIVAGVSGLGGGDVVLLHDAIEGPLAPAALDRSATVAAVPAIVALARGRGLQLTALA